MTLKNWKEHIEISDGELDGGVPGRSASIWTHSGPRGKNLILVAIEAIAGDKKLSYANPLSVSISWFDSNGNRQDMRLSNSDWDALVSCLEILKEMYKQTDIRFEKNGLAFEKDLLRVDVEISMTEKDDSQ